MRRAKVRSLGSGMVVYISQSIKRNTAPLWGRSAYLGGAIQR